MIAAESEIPPVQPVPEREIPILKEGKEKIGEKLAASFKTNESFSTLSTNTDESNCIAGQSTTFASSSETENLVDPTLQDVLGDNVAINFDPTGRCFVETEVNFMTASMSLSMRRTVRTRAATTQQRPPFDTETALALITKPCVNYRVKAREILKFVKSDPHTADLKITFYMVACESRAALKPYPTSVVEETDVGQESLTLLNEEIPSVKLLKLVLSDLSQNKTSSPVVAILHWLFIILQEPKLKRLPAEAFHGIFQKVDKAVNFQQPTHVFKLMFNRYSTTETTWQAKKGNRRSYFAFYTDSLDKMHSIIHLGFYPAVLKYKDKFGPGVFLYTDLKHCLDNAGSSSGWGWGKSDLGVEMRVILVAEFLEDPGIKYFNELEFSSDQKALTRGTEDKDELYCYYVPRASEIRIRYILVYVQTTARSLPFIVPIRQKTFFTWVGEHKTSLLLGGTLILTLATKNYVHLLSMIHGLKAMMLRSVFYNVEIND